MNHPSTAGVPGFGSLAREHLEHPRNTGSWPASAAHLRRFTGEAGSVAAGAFVRFRIALDAHRIAAVRYEVLGGPALMATASWLSEYLIGKKADPTAVPAGLDMARVLELERVEHGMALLVEDAARNALNSVATGLELSPKA
jgi:NifU-like protein involved in Fe-S cluster formation